MFTVLVAENCVNQHSGLFDILNTHFNEECVILKARNKQELIYHIENTIIDIVLLDMDMSGISCGELDFFLRNSGHHCVILPIAELNTFDHSCHPNTHSVLDYLLKPFTDTELILTLEEALEQCRKDPRHVHTPIRSELPPEEVSRIDIVRKKIHQYITDHYSEIISMQDVAHAMNYSDTHFCRLFKQCFRVNFSVYLNDYRISQAKHLLTSTNQTVKDVGFSCGYRDTSYFIRVFKRNTGMTPSDYRIHKLTMTAKKSNKS